MGIVSNSFNTHKIKMKTLAVIIKKIIRHFKCIFYNQTQPFKTTLTHSVIARKSWVIFSPVFFFVMKF